MNNVKTNRYEATVKKAIFGKTNNSLDTAVLALQSVVVSVEEKKEAIKTVNTSWAYSVLPTCPLVWDDRITKSEEVIWPVGQGVVKFKESGHIKLTNQLLMVVFSSKLPVPLMVDCFYVRKNLNNPIIVFADPEMDGEYRQLTDSVEIKNDLNVFPTYNKEGAYGDPETGKHWRKFVFMSATTAGMRRDVGIYVDISAQTGIDMDTVDSIRGDMTNGASTLAIASKAMMDQAKLSKVFSRFGQKITYHRKMENICLDVANIEFGKGLDGIMVLRAKTLAVALSAQQGIEITPEDIAFKMFQCRPATVKAMGVALTEEEFAHFYYTVMGETVSKDDLPDAIADKNCFKADVIDGIGNISWDIMAPMTMMRQPKFSSQIWAKLIGTKNFNAILDRAATDLIKENFDCLDTTSDISITEATNGVASQLIYKKSVLGSKFRGVSESAIKTQAESALYMAERMNVTIPNSIGLRICGDMAELYGIVEEVIPFGRLYSPSVPANTAVVCFRHPCPMQEEFYRAQSMTLKEVLRNINILHVSGKINTEQLSFLHSFYKGMDRNMVVAPASKTFRTLTGGSDVDTDMMIVCWDELIVESLADVEPIAIETRGPKSRLAAKYVMNQDGMSTAFSIAIKAPKIGPLCNLYSWLIEFKYLDTDKKLSIWEEAVQGGVGDYTERRLVGSRAVTLDDAERTLDKIKNARFHADNIDIMIADLLIVVKTWIDRAIDAVKTGDLVKITRWVNSLKKKINFGAFKGIQAEFKRDASGFSVMNSTINTEGNAPFELGVLGKIKTTLANAVVLESNRRFADQGSLENKEIKLLSGYSNCSVANDFTSLKYMFSNIAGMKSSVANDLRSMGLKDEHIRQHVADFKKFNEAIGDMGYGLVEAACEKRGIKVNPEMLGLTAFAASVKTADGMRDIATSNFAVSVFGKEMIAVAQKHYEMAEYATQECYLVNNASLVDGEPVVMKNGVGYLNGQAVLITDTKVSGDAFYTINNNKDIVVMQLCDIFKARSSYNKSVVLQINLNSIDAGDATRAINSAKEVAVRFANGKGENFYIEAGNARVPFYLNMRREFACYATKDLIENGLFEVNSTITGTVKDDQGGEHEYMYVLLSKTGMAPEIEAEAEEIYTEEVF